MNIFADPRRVLSYGAFDELGAAELDTLRRLARMGDDVIIGLGTDAFLTGRGQTPQRPFEERRQALMNSLYVDHVIPQNDLEQTRTDIVNYNVSVLAVTAPVLPRIDELDALTQVVFLQIPRGPKSATDGPAPTLLHPEAGDGLLKTA